jgi:hypothetical protein
MNSHKGDLNQIFYNYNKFDIYTFNRPDDILRLEPLFFSLSKHEMEMELVTEKEKEKEKEKESMLPIIIDAPKQTEHVLHPHPATKTKEPEIKKSKKWFEPLQKDTIFWCVFSFIYGHTEYLMVGSRYGNRELEEKGKMMSYLNESKKQLKNINHKITNANIQEILSEFLALQNETTFLGIIGLVAFYKIRILLVDENRNLYVDFHIVDTETKTCILYKNTTGKGSRGAKYRMNMDLEETESEVSRIQTNMLRLEHFTKPLRAISSYKLSELEEISKIIGLSNNDKLKKPELYARITEYCNWNAQSV